MMKSERYQKGEKILEKLGSGGAARIEEMLKDVAPDMAQFVVEFPFGDIYSRPGLDLKSRELCTIAALTVLGHSPKPLAAHINNALAAGATKQEIIEVIMQMAVYGGFPVALNALHVAKEAITKK